MSEVLTTDEIDQILNAISKENEPNEKILPVDFCKFDTFSKKELKQICYLAENFCAEFSNQRIFMHVFSVDQLTLSEFKSCVPDPTTIIQSFYGDTGIVIEVDPLLSFCLVGKENEVKSNRELFPEEFSELKSVFLKSFISSFTKKLEDFSFPETELREIKYTPSPELIESNCPNGTGCLITFECKVGDTKEGINIFIPWKTAKRILDYKFRTSSKSELELSDIQDSQANVDVLFGTANLTTEQLQKIKQEEIIIPLKELRSSEPLLRINNKPVAKVSITGNEDKVRVSVEELIKQDQIPTGKRIISKKKASTSLEAFLELASMPLNEALEINTSVVFEAEKLLIPEITVRIEGAGNFKGELLTINDNFGVKILQDIPEIEAVE